MENYQGDLADIIRAGGGPISGTLAGTTTSSTTTDSWQFQSDPMNYQEDFGLPFPSLRDDPLLLNELDMSFFTSSNSLEKDTGGYFGNYVGHKIDNNIDHHQEEIIKRPCNNNIFSRMLQISPSNAKLPILPLDSPTIMAASSRRVLKGPPPSLILPNDHVISGNSSKASSCLIENTGVQISSPQNSGIKRRKSQAKKVVCIPAPAPANSRPTGEIVPSDLWAWRKYGQKPIKGSPYPRGYYRCSSSKGCSARKQVERSRTDPNMLVITYTSEHNHPWPTQRNALAGSTRSTTQPTKNNAINNSPAASKNSPTISHQSQKAPDTAFKEEQKDQYCNNNLENTTANSRIVKEEEMDDKEIEMEDGDQFSEGFATHDQSYKPPALLVDQSINSDQDFFADLGEIESNPLNLLFTQGFSGDEEREISNKGLLDPFSFYDWTGNSNSNSNSNNTSFGDHHAKRGS